MNDYGDIYQLLKDVEDPEAELFANEGNDNPPQSQRSHVGAENHTLESLQKNMEIDKNFSDEEIQAIQRDQEALKN